MHMNIAHMVVSSLIHGLIYALIFKAYHALGLMASLVVTVVGVGLLWLLFGARSASRSGLSLAGRLFRRRL